MKSPCPQCGIKEQCVRSIALFSELDDQAFELLHTLVRHRDLEPRGLLFLAGESFADLVLVRRGCLLLVSHGPDGEEVVTERLAAGGVYGAELLFADQPRHGQSGVAASASSFCLIRRRDIHDLIAREPSLALRLLADLNARLHRSHRRLFAAGVRDVTKRIAVFLLDQPGAARGRITDWSQEEIGHNLYLTKETVNRHLKQMEGQGIVQIKGRKQIRILDYPRLVHLATGETAWGTGLDRRRENS